MRSLRSIIFIVCSVYAIPTIGDTTDEYGFPIGQTSGNVSNPTISDTPLEWHIDLTNGNVSGDLPESHIGKEVSFILTNKAPGASYDIEYHRIRDNVSAFNNAVFASEQEPPKDNGGNTPNLLAENEEGSDEAKAKALAELISNANCKLLLANTSSLQAEKDETKTKNILSEVTKSYKHLEAERGTSYANKCLAALKYTDLMQVKKMTTRFIAKLNVKPGERIIFKVSKAPDTIDAKEWRQEYGAGERGTWSPTWGFAFFENKSESYYTKSDGASQYNVVKGKSSAEIEMTPIVMFSWGESSLYSSNWDCGITGGLGLDLTNPTVLVGGNCTYNQNIVLSLGYAARQFKALKSRFNTSDKYSQAFESTDLVEDVYMGTAFLSVTYRFGSSPF